MLQVWEPLSNQQKQAASVVEVFRIVEEVRIVMNNSQIFMCLIFLCDFSLQTVDHLFGLNLPMDISHLQALLSIIFHALDGYLQNLVSQLGTTLLYQHLYSNNLTSCFSLLNFRLIVDHAFKVLMMLYLLCLCLISS